MTLTYRIVEGKLSSDDYIPIWNDIVYPQLFYDDVIYWEWTGEIIPYKKTYYDTLDDAGKQRYINNNYGGESEHPQFNAVVYDGETLVGWICWEYLQDGKKKVANLKYIIIRENMQRKAFGSEMMNWWIATIKKERCNIARLAFNYNVRGLKEFYGKLKFKGNPALGSHTTWERKFTYR
jgi:GNAT superfamily N-acetyltransferase